MNPLREYVEHVLSELAKDEKFIKHLKASKTRQVVDVSHMEKFADEWLAMQRNVKPAEVRLARRLAVDKFPEMFERARGDVTIAKRMLFSVLSSHVIQKKRTP